MALHEFRGMILTSFSTHCYAQAQVQPLQWEPPQLDAHLTPPLKGKPTPGREDENAFVELFAGLDTVVQPTVQDKQDNDLTPDTHEQKQPQSIGTKDETTTNSDDNGI